MELITEFDLQRLETAYNGPIDIAFAVTAHELMPKLIAEIRRLRSHLNPPVNAPDPENGPMDRERTKCPFCGSRGPFTAIQAQVCGDCGQCFQKRE